MNLGQWAFKQTRLFLILTLMFSFLGVISLMVIPKDEDPRLPDWFASIFIALPGGEVSQIDEMIARPLNEKLKEIDELKKVETTTRTNFTSIQIEMKDKIKDTKMVWDKVRIAINEIKKDFPAGTLEPVFYENTNRLETILFAITGVEDLIELKKAALKLKKNLLNVPGTSTILLHGDPHEELQVRYEPQAIEALAVSQGQILHKIRSSNTGVPAGSIDLGDQSVPIVIPSRITSDQQVAQLRLMKGSGDTVTFDQFAKISVAPKRLESVSYWNSQPALFLGVVAQSSIDILKYGELIRQKVAAYQKSNPSNQIRIHEVSFNPDRTKERLDDLLINLILGILTVGLILWAWTGWKIAITVSIFVPAISLVGFFFYSLSGGVLHQISLAAFVISLGQFIDNIIVIVEWIDSEVKDGSKPMEAAIKAINQFKKPMFFATGTNISAFLPMLLSTGSTAEFTHSIPLVAIITMITAWIMALFVVPTFTAYLFKYFPSKSLSHQEIRSPLWGRFGKLIAAKPLQISLGSLAIILLSSIGFLFVRKQFFPSADRNQLTVKIELPTGTRVEKTKSETLKLISFLEKKSVVQFTTSFIGEGIPRFYYNVGLNEWGPHVAELIVVTRDKSENRNVINEIHAFTAKELPGAFVLAKNLEQGPPVPAPLEYKIFDEDSEKLAKASAQIKKSLERNSHGLIYKDNIGVHVPRLSLTFDQDLSERFGLTDDQLAIALLSSTNGVSVTKYFQDGKAKDVRLLSQKLNSLEEMMRLPIRSSAFRDLKLQDIAKIKKEESRAVIHRLNGEKLVQVFGWPGSDQSADQIASALKGEIESIGKQNDVRISLGGDIEGSGEANMAILKVIPLGLLVLIICLLLEFNSIRKMMIILMSVPFVIAGVTPGLLLGRAAFGFMSLLGVLALVGVVVNNSILLIESIDELREKNLSIQEAIVRALETRMRPILLTAVTTIAGLVPMAFEESTLWPPLALAMISGLVGSTMITLAFVPSLYLLCFSFKSLTLRPQTAFLALTALAVSLLLGSTDTAEAKSYTFKEALAGVELKSPEYLASKSENEKIQELKTQSSQAAFFPKVGIQAESRSINKQLTLGTPFGSFPYGKQGQLLGGVEVTQPLFNYKEMKFDQEKNQNLVQASAQEKLSTLQKNKRQLIFLLVELSKLDVTAQSLRRLEESLLGIEKEVEKFVKIGTRGKADLLNVRLSLSENRTNQKRTQALEKVLIEQIRVFLPDFDFFEGDINGPARAQGDTSSPDNRPELKTINSILRAQRSELSGLRSGHLPTLEFKGRYIYADNDLYDQRDWYEVGVVLKWALFEGGTRRSAESAQTKEILKIEKQREFIQAQLKAERTQLLADRETLSFQSKTALDDLKLAEAARDEDRKNSQLGRVPLRDWLNSEIRLEQKKLEIETLNLGKIRSEYDDLFTQGIEIK